MDGESINCWPPPSPPMHSEEDKCDLHTAHSKSLGDVNLSEVVHDKKVQSKAGVQEEPPPRKRIHGDNSNKDSRIANVKCRRNMCNSEERQNHPLAEVALAKWWRSVGRHLVDQRLLPESKNPRTLLKWVARSKEGQHFLQDEVKRLQTRLDGGERGGNVRAALGSFFEKLQDFKAAHWHLEKAVAFQPQDAEYRWLLEKVKKQLSVSLVQSTSVEQLKSLSYGDCLPCSTEVERRSAQDLSLSEFFFKYAMTNTPVIICDLVASMTYVPWTLQHIKEVAGTRQVCVKRLVPDSVEWARLEDSSTLTVSQFIDGLNGSQQTPGGRDKNYLFDWSLPQHCPELAQQLSIPKYFANDFLQRTTPGSLYHDSWPSLFIAPAGLTSELHIDAFGSNFWMALFEGKKRWTFFAKESLPYLYPDYTWSMDPVFDVDLSKPNLQTTPLLALTKPQECILEPGELLFVPAGCPHRVENLEKSLAISSNFVDLSNLDLVCQELNINGLVDERSAALAEQLSDPGFPVKMSSQLGHMGWKEFKNWPKPDYEVYDLSAAVRLDIDRQRSQIKS